MRKPKDIKPISDSDKDFFLKFYEEHKRFLYYIARQYAPAQADCEDLVQEATLRLLNNVSSLRKINGCKTTKYIVLTIRTAFLDCEKHKHGCKALPLDDEMLETLLKAETVIADSFPEIAARLEVERLKKSLSPRDWLVLEGKYILGYSQDELGALLGVSPDSVRMILCRARKNAQKILRNDFTFRR